MKSILKVSLSVVTILMGSALSPTFATAQSLIKADGSSTVYPITDMIAKEFQGQAGESIKVKVEFSGTGGGFKKFCRGETEVQDASRPINEGERKDCAANDVDFVELPIAYDAIVVVVNPKNDWVSHLSVEQLKKMWSPDSQDKITTWKQIDPSWPDEPLKLYGAGTDSGTFDYFTEAVNGKSKVCRKDFIASEDDNTLVQGVSLKKGGLGYIPFSYYEENKSKLKVVGIIGGDKSPKKGEPVLPNKASVEAGHYYPLSRPLFVYFSAKGLKKPEVQKFAEYFMKNVSQTVPKVKYVALPSKAYELATARLAKIQTGSIFGGHADVGLKIEDLLKKESSSK